MLKTKITCKKGQFYIITALILVVMTFAALSYTTQIKEPAKEKDIFTELHENYERQVVKTVNNALIEEKGYNRTRHLYTEVETFTIIFLEYAHVTKPTFNMLYALSYLNETEVHNYLDETITMNGQELESGQSVIIIKPETLNITFIDHNYIFEIGENVQINTLFEMQDEDRYGIYAK